jgi:hypothetical protein
MAVISRMSRSEALYRHSPDSATSREIFLMFAHGSKGMDRRRRPVMRASGLPGPSGLKSGRMGVCQHAHLLSSALRLSISFRYAGTGGARSRAISVRMSANICRGTATPLPALGNDRKGATAVAVATAPPLQAVHRIISWRERARTSPEPTTPFYAVLTL